MIRPIKITLNAAHPEVPLIEATTFVGSPSAVFVSGVPATVGLWRITAVKVVAHYPDDSATTVECVKGASGVWTATLPATATSGRVTHGFEVLADGLDERGDAVTGYVLGYADFAVFTRDMTIESGGTVYYMHFFDAVPETPKKGDVAPDGSGGLQLYNGSAWVSMGGYTPPAGGIPKTDLSAGVQASLDKADSALQSAPVSSVNNKTGAVTLTASDVGAVPTAGGEVTGPLVVDTPQGNYCVMLGNSPQLGIGDGVWWTQSKDVTLAGACGIYCVSLMGNLAFFSEGNEISLPSRAGILALLEDIAVKSVKLNGSPLTPDANGAVNVPALPLTGGTITGDLTITTALWLHYLNSSAFGGDLFRFKRFDDATDEPYDVMRREDLAGLAPLASPAFTGTPTAPTPSAGDNSTKVATTAFVKTAVDGATPNLDYVMRVNPETGEIYYTTPDANANA